MPKANMSGKTKATMAGGKRVKKGKAFVKKKTSVDRSLPLVSDVNMNSEEIVSSRTKITHAELNVSQRQTRSTTAARLKPQQKSSSKVRARGQLKQVRRNNN